jgi:O-antigen/teichoic acid export membrane protein
MPYLLAVSSRRNCYPQSPVIIQPSIIQMPVRFTMKIAVFSDFITFLEMKKILSAFIQQCRADPRKVFLLDGIGALATALLLLALVAPLEGFFKMPATMVYKLSILAVAFASYSLCCWYVNPKQWKRYLAIIALANLLYCLLTLALVLYHWHTISVWGIAYFLGEVMVIVLLVAIETRVLQRGKPVH